MSKFDNVFKKYLKENLADSLTKGPIPQQVATAEKQGGPQTDAVKALGATLMGDPHVQDFNKLLDPKNNEFKSIGDFLQKHQDLAPRFAELGMVQPQNQQQPKTETPTANTTQNPASTVDTPQGTNTGESNGY
jgi:hypothetical protein